MLTMLTLLLNGVGTMHMYVILLTKHGSHKFNHNNYKKYGKQCCEILSLIYLI